MFQNMKTKLINEKLKIKKIKKIIAIINGD